jgi:hypothetical protein
MVGTGQGIDDVDKPTFQQYVVDTICKYYFELLPVLGNRPNIQPHFTNEHDEDSSHSMVNGNKNDCILEDDDESLFDEHGNKIEQVHTSKVIDAQDNDKWNKVPERQSTSRMYIDLLEEDDDDYDDEFAGVKQTDRFKKTTVKERKSIPSSVSTMTSTNHSSTKSLLSPVSSVSSTNNRKESPTKKQKIDYNDKPLTPIDAKRIQNNLLKRHKKQIHGGKTTNKTFGMIEQEQDDRDFLKQCRSDKFEFETNKHKDEKAYKRQEILLSKEKISIDKARLDMDKEQAILIQNKIKAETALNDQKVMLVKLQMFKEREDFKKKNPDVAEDYVNSLFPV